MTEENKELEPVQSIEEATLDDIIASNVQVTEVEEEQVSQEVSPVQDMEKEEREVTKTQPNVKEYFRVLEEPDHGSPDLIHLPAETTENTQKALLESANAEIGTTEKQREWAFTLNQSISYVPVSDMYVRRLNDPNSKFTQVLEYQGTKLFGSSPGNKHKEGVTEVEGERALLKLVTHLGIGGMHRTPLYNSGFWVYFKPPRDIDLLELNIIINSDKVMLGRDSYGLAHTNHVSYSMSRVFEMAMRHVYEISVKQSELPLSKLGDYIDPQDIHSFIWGFLCATYPSGFHYERACINDPSKCNHVVKGNLSIQKTLVVDESRLNDWQKNHMRSFSANTMTLADVKRYKSELTHLHEKRVILMEGTPHETAITLKTPTVNEYINQSHKYISMLVEQVNRSLSVDSNNNERNMAIDQSSRAMKLCQWAHFISAIEFGQLTNPSGPSSSLINDRDTIVQALATLSSTDSISEKIIDEIKRYVEDSTIAIMAIPAYNCPVCDKPQEEATQDKYPRFAAYIPLDILQVFFGLLARRINRITER